MRFLCLYERVWECYFDCEGFLLFGKMFFGGEEMRSEQELGKRGFCVCPKLTNKSGKCKL